MLCARSNFLTFQEITAYIAKNLTNEPYIGFAFYYDNCVDSIIVLSSNISSFLEKMEKNQSIFNIVAVILGFDVLFITNRIYSLNQMQKLTHFTILEQEPTTKSQKKLNTDNVTLTKKQIQEILFSLSDEELHNLGYTEINHTDNSNCSDFEEETNEDNSPNEDYSDFSYQTLSIQQVKDILDNIHEYDLYKMGYQKLA